MAQVDVNSFKPGQQVTCTVAKLPRTENQEGTIARLMRRDPDNKRALDRAHRMRQQRLNVYNRGNRDWVSREPAAKVVIIKQGATWTMPFTPDIAADMNSVGEFIEVKAK